MTILSDRNWTLDKIAPEFFLPYCRKWKEWSQFLFQTVISSDPKQLQSNTDGKENIIFKK